MIVVLCISIVGNFEYFLFPHFVFCISIACILNISYFRILCFFISIDCILSISYFCVLYFVFCICICPGDRCILYVFGVVLSSAFVLCGY